MSGPAPTSGSSGPSATPTGDVLRLLFERAPEIITLTDPEGRQIYVNEAAEHLLGVGPSNGHPFDGRIYVHPDDRPRLAAHRQVLDQRTSADEPAPAFRFRVRAASGEWRWLEMVLADMSDVPEVGGRVAFSRDVTEAEARAQALVESDARLEALIASFRGGAFVESADGQVLLVNQGLTELGGSQVTAEDLVGRASDELLADLGRAVTEPDALVRAAQDATREHVDLELELRSGRWLDVEVIPIVAHGTSFGRLWLFHDATPRRQAELQQQWVLDRERGARRDAEVQTERLKAYDHLRNEFVARVSHELRTPLTSIASASELLLSDRSELTPEARQHLDIIRRNADRLRDMVEDLLLVGRLDAGMITLEPQAVSLPDIVQDALRHVEDAARRRDVALVVEGPRDGTIVADARRLTEVIDNLLGNAVKFTNPGTEVVVSLSRQDDVWSVTVRDHGPGIQPELRDAVFDRFVRSADADRRGTPGSGLGLAIVKGIVALHGGTVSVSDAPGGGAVFACILPADGPDGAASTRPPVEIDQVRRGR